MSNSIPLPHEDDRYETEQLHGRIVGQINDMLIPSQDASYALGRARGQQDSADVWDALARLVSGLDATSWSSWQTTAHFADDLESARQMLKARVK